ncbi:NifB/NifX family molybdenum-iron cluster-binding protein [Rhodopseudomonas palustris]|uniref:NifB/NifX family molybdenum-iron cluster-binding protein n=1 Tax=Rhodopseudomonas palustris TaxID=1076 RepID=UPI0022F02489|nr:NifB/NifX family molybdenum-iron cluster-binding protein [Rhodopseudomonas palustris]WBU31191.1 NifB/NifX family molybdenum-iron cluster-binding protein [Rhodopseudomonas palustris]
MIRVAFASNDRRTVNLHFGGAESLVIYDIAPGQADLVGVGTFMKAEQIGETGRVGLTGTVHDKVLPKLDFVEGCAAVYAASIGTSSIRRLMAQGVQPIIVDNGHDILDLLNEVSLALVHGGLSWVERAKAKADAAAVANRLQENPADRETHRLLTSVDELE